MIAAMRTLTGLSIADITNRIAKQIEEGTMPLTVTEESNGSVTPVPLSMLKNIIQRLRQIELETQTDVALETDDIDDPRDFIPRDADWTQ